MNIYVYHMLQSSGVQAGSYPKTEVKENHLPVLERVILNLIFQGFHFQKIGLSSMIKVHMFSIEGIWTSRKIQHISLIAEQSVTSRRVDSEIWCSPGSCQLLQLQHFPKIQNISGPSFYFVFCSAPWFCLMFAQEILLCQCCLMVCIDFFPAVRSV